MSKIVDGIFMIESEPLAKREDCGQVAELRPYGPDGSNICFPCAMKVGQRFTCTRCRRVTNIYWHR